MLDIRLIREKPAFVKERLATRGGGDEARIDDLLKEDADSRQKEAELDQLLYERKKLSKEIGARRGRGESSDDLEERVLEIKNLLEDYSAMRDLLDRTIGPILEIPNLPHISVPLDANRVVRTWGEAPR